MSRAEFLAALRAGLRGVPQTAVEEIVADYAAHFDEGVAVQRSEADIAAALGEPRVIAGELRMEMRIEDFEAAPSVRSGLRVLTGAWRHGVASFVLLCAVALMLLVVPVAAMAIGALVGAGGWFFVEGSSLELNGGMATIVLCGVGLIAAAVSLMALLMLAGHGLVHLVGRYTRLRSRILPRSSQPGIPT
jgi:uncharacterized membrane protein